MASRKDPKGRALRQGESMRKDGRYRFSYTEDGKRKHVYSWKLEPIDRVPKGKQDCRSLREMEKEIKERLAKKAPVAKKNLTVYELAEQYTSIRRDVRMSTRKGYGTVLNRLEKDPFGQQRVEEIKTSDAKKWIAGLQAKGLSYSTIHTIRGVLNPAFQMLVEDDLLDKNPFNFALSSVIYNDTVQRNALSNEDEERFLDFVKNDKIYAKYYEGMYILFKTGLRISEFCGLTINDINFDEMTINIERQLLKFGYDFAIVPTKTSAGTRLLPMKEDVAECFRKIISNRINLPKKEPEIEGKSGFLYFNIHGNPYVEYKWAHVFQAAVKKYNKRFPDKLPPITPHICRHTYCSNMAKTGINPKALQYLMGHSEIAITMDTYTHLGFEDAKRELERVG